MNQRLTQKALWMALATLPAFANAAEPAIAAEDAAQDAVLPEVSVSVSKEAEEKFRADSTSVATKTETALRDVPQSVSVVTEELIKSQRAFNLRDALRNVSGLSIAAGEGGRTGDSITLRGYAASSDMYLDGVKDNGQYNRDTFFIERAEVLKGASSIMFGRGSTGGVINQVSKQADGKTHLESNVSYGTDDFKRVTIDAGTALNDVVSVRLNALWQDADSFRDENYVEREGLAPSIKFTFSEDTSLTLDYLYQHENSAFDYGVPMFHGRPADVSTSRFYGFKDDLLQHYVTNIATATLKHAFTDDFSVKNTLRYGDYYRKYRSLIISGVNQTAATATFSQSLRDSHQQNLINQTDFVWTAPLFGLPNTLAFGAEFGEEEFDFRQKNSTGTRTVSIFDPVFADTWGTGLASNFGGTLNTNRRVRVKTSAAYIQDQLELTKQWKVLAGVRYDDFEADQTNVLDAADNDFDTGAHVWSPRAAVIWQPLDTHSYYVSYGESFNPIAEQFSLVDTVSEENVKPETNRNMEVGAKWDLLDGRLSLTSAIYRLEKDNARSTNNGITSLSGKQRTDGFELGLAGEIASNWDISAAYSYMDGEVVDSANTTTGAVSGATKSLEGMTSQNVPRHSGTIWTTYKFLENWEVGGGVYAVGSRYTDTVEEVKLPGYVRLDGVVAYHQPKYDVQLNVYNLLDKRYYESGQTRSALPGVPLSGMLTLTLHY
ncbi:MAG TPA: TonB-dependent siderophore receptor [Methylophilaceae bacterium]|nr:TonB-dependent siderophore receptor [Methylophilaceae bacterium]